MKLFLLVVGFLLPLGVQCQFVLPSAQPPKPEDPNELREYILRPLSKEIYRRNGQYDKANALLRYAKLDPADAREIALSELASANPEIACDGLLFLDDAELPQLTEAFRQNLRSETYWGHLKCVERYGTEDLLPGILHLYESAKGNWACDIAAGSLGFVVKHDRVQGLKLVDEAVTLRNKTGCYQDVMLDVLKNYPGDDVLELSSKYVGDSVENVSINAADLVSRQEGGKERLIRLLQNNDLNITEKARVYIQQFIERPRE